MSHHHVHFRPTILHFAKDSYIFVEGKRNADKFYIVKHGTVRLSRENEDLHDNIMKSGDIFGVISVMAGHGYTMSAIAVTDVTLIVVERKHYSDLIRKTGSVAMKNINQFSLRLKELNDHLSSRLLTDRTAEGASLLYQTAQYYEKKRKIDYAEYTYRQYLAHNPNAENAGEIKKKLADMQSRIFVERPLYPPNTMVQKYPKNCILYAEGETAHDLYIVQRGAVKLTRILNGQEAVLAVLCKGDIFGEMAMLDGKPRATTAEISADCSLLAVNRDNFHMLVHDHPEMVEKLASLMAEKVWLLYRQLDNTFIDDPLARLYDALIIHLEKKHVDLTSGAPYQCGFGYKELAGMAALSTEKDDDLYNKFIEKKIVTVKDDKLLINDVSEAFGEARFFRDKRK